MKRKLIFDIVQFPCVIRVYIFSEVFEGNEVKFKNRWFFETTRARARARLDVAVETVLTELRMSGGVRLHSHALGGRSLFRGPSRLVRFNLSPASDVTTRSH